jgi:hypothetical protein
MQFWSALIYMYWSLLTNKDDLMDCKSENPVQVRHLCYYTYACLRGFPILAANMVLVLMVRILIQWRMYYSMLEMQVVVDFTDAPIRETSWPWFCGISILSGASHLVLKMVYDPADVPLSSIMSVAKKLILPGIIFFSFLWRYADVENTLIPLNRIIEREYTRSQRDCPWLTELLIANERVFAYDIRQRDVVGETLASIGKAPTIRDVMENLSAHYEDAHAMWLAQHHNPWGLLRALWPAAALVDRRLDRNDRETRTWLIVFCILMVGCGLSSVGSLVFLFKSGTSVSIRKQWAMKNTRTDLLTLDAVLIFHAVIIVLFLLHSFRNMFFHATSKTLLSYVPSVGNPSAPEFSHSTDGGGSPMTTRAGSVAESSSSSVDKYKRKQ